MKIIDLLNKIANEKEIPQKIKFDTYVYSWHDKEHGYCRYESDNFYICLNSEYYLFDILNDEVEIIEEEKKTKSLTKKDIEALGYACGEIQKCFTNGWTKSLENKPLEEEKKIPEKLPKWATTREDKEYTKQEDTILIVSQKVDEIIDYLKSKGE